MNEFLGLLNKMNLAAIPLNELKSVTNEYIGTIISFDRSFYTKNVPRLDHYNDGKFKMKGDLNLDPHIHCRIGEFKIILSIDPKWLTTTTSFVNMRMGSSSFAGLFLVKDINLENKYILGTPIIIGIPKSP